MSRIPPPSFIAGRDRRPWDDHEDQYYNYIDPSTGYLDPDDRDEYDDFVNDTARPHPNLPRANVALMPSGSIRQSYQTRRPSFSSSYYSSQNSRKSLTPPQSYSPERGFQDNANQYDNYPYSSHSPTRSQQSYPSYSQDSPPRDRSGSPTRLPLTGAATGAYTGYEMAERKPGSLIRVPTAKWLKEEKKGRSKRKWIIIGIVLFILAAVAAGVTVYLVKFRNSGSSGSGSSPTNTGSSNGRNGYGATSSDLKTDSKLHKIFDGMDYTPLNAQYPACGATQTNITADVAILSQLTTKIRLYGTDCEQADMVLKAIQDLKVDLTVFLGVWVDTNSTTLQRQLSAMYDILKKYPVNLIDGIAVGNEVLFRQDLTEPQLITLIQQVRTNVTNMGLSKTLPICTSDLGSKWTASMAAAVDCVMANIHPFFSGIDVHQASNWTLQFLTDNVVSTTTGLTTKPEIIISEVGWPSGGGAVNSSVAGITESQFFIDNFLPAAKNAGVKYYYFEGYDEPWKIIFNTATAQYEDKWGLLDVNGYLKNGITLPSSV